MKALTDGSDSNVLLQVDMVNWAYDNLYLA